MTDVNVFVRRSRRNAEREAVGLALMRQQVNVGKLKVTWMSEEEKAAYRLREPPEVEADRGGFMTRNPNRRHVAHPGAIKRQGCRAWHPDDRRG